MSTVIEEIAAERARQISAEGWTPAHDDEHDTGALARAAACYAKHGAQILYAKMPVPDEWPWSEESWKPKGARRDLVRAAALIIAEIERLDREAARTKSSVRRPVTSPPIAPIKRPDGIAVAVEAHKKRLRGES